MLRISVITVVLNGVKTIERTIRSVIEQDYPNLEYIIIDGGSADGTVEMIKKYEKDITYWVSEQDEGIYHAMNKGIQCATGDYINFLNSDDWFEEGVLFRVAEFAQDIQADVYYGDVLRVGSKQEEKMMPEDLDHLHWHFTFGHQGTFVKRTKGLKFDTRYKIAADYKMMLDLYVSNKEFVHMPFVVAHFGQEGISVRNEYNTMIETVDIASTHILELKDSKRTYYIEKIEDIYVEAEFWHRLETNEGRVKFGEYIKKSLKYENRIVIFGAGNMSKRLVRVMKDAGCTILYIVDNYNNTKIDDIDVYLPEHLQKERNADILIGSFNFSVEIYKQIKGMKLHDSINIFSFKELMSEYIREVRNDYICVGAERIKSFEELIRG